MSSNDTSVVASPPRHVHRIVIAAPIERVWRALTDEQESARWYFGTGVRATWRDGEPYAYRYSDGRVAIEGVVEHVEPPRLLVMTFSARWNDAVAGDPPSRVTYELTAEQGLTTVALIHDDLAAGSATAAEVTGGWPYLLSNLKSFVETGSPMAA